jgi:hypothetical protein
MIAEGALDCAVVDEDPLEWMEGSWAFSDVPNLDEFVSCQADSVCMGAQGVPPAAVCMESYLESAVLWANRVMPQPNCLVL